MKSCGYGGCATTAHLFADDEFVGAVDNDCYTWAFVEPGERLLWTSDSRWPRLAELLPGHIYVVLVSRYRIQSVHDQTLDRPDYSLDSLGGYCEATPKERNAGIRMLNSEYPIAIALQGRSCMSCQERKIARKVLEEWPHVDLTPYSTLAIDFTISEPKAQEEGWLAESARRTDRRFASHLANQVDDELFETVTTDKGHRPVETVILRIDVPRYEKEPFKREISYMKFKISFIDAADGRTLISFVGQPHWWAKSDTAAAFEESMTFALLAYLELSKCGNRITTSSASDKNSIQRPYICKAREPRSE